MATRFWLSAELNIRTIFEKAFTGVHGHGYPAERRESQVRNPGILTNIKIATAKIYLDGLLRMRCR
jgi:ribose 5-phosphate isomerase B